MIIFAEELQMFVFFPPLSRGLHHKYLLFCDVRIKVIYRPINIRMSNKELFQNQKTASSPHTLRLYIKRSLADELAECPSHLSCRLSRHVWLHPLLTFMFVPFPPSSASPVLVCVLYSPCLRTEALSGHAFIHRSLLNLRLSTMQSWPVMRARSSPWIRVSLWLMMTTVSTACAAGRPVFVRSESHFCLQCSAK